MTTIAYKDGIIAYDSRVTSGNTIVDDNEEKKHVVDGVTFFIAGSMSDIPKLFDLYFGRIKEAIGGSIQGMAIENGELYSFGYSESGFWKSLERKANPSAAGSGTDHALTAMDMGATAEEAVKLACKRDCKSGGTIRTYRLGTP